MSETINGIGRDAKHSFYDKMGKSFVSCSECNRGGNGGALDKCSCGWNIKKGGNGGCFMGELIIGLRIVRRLK